ncbi:MAG: hypothetical protein BIFFINMI_00075 [Phycisphaerae bacterium]|nr:hypothetical protein [Phycisphaerae bacterium]
MSDVQSIIHLLVAQVVMISACGLLCLALFAAGAVCEIASVVLAGMELLRALDPVAVEHADIRGADAFAEQN